MMYVGRKFDDTGTLTELSLGYFLSVSAGLVRESDWSAVRDPGGSAGECQMDMMDIGSL